MLLVVQEDGSLRAPHHDAPNPYYFPYGWTWWIIGETVKHCLTANQCVHSLTLLNAQLLACALEAK